MTAYLLNLLDLAFTIYALSLGCAELNPLMQPIPIMIFYKVVVVGLLAAWLSRRPERAAKVGLRICTAVYAGLDCYHLMCLILIGGMIC